MKSKRILSLGLAVLLAGAWAFGQKEERLEAEIARTLYDYFLYR
jgi:hypothetical protein